MSERMPPTARKFLGNPLDFAARSRYKVNPLRAGATPRASHHVANPHVTGHSAEPGRLPGTRPVISRAVSIPAASTYRQAAAGDPRRARDAHHDPASARTRASGAHGASLSRGSLYRAGLVNCLRPPADIGTKPYHCWLTSFGAATVEAEDPRARSEEPSGVAATALITELWLSVRDEGATGGVRLERWRRLRSGVKYQDARTGASRVLPVKAELTVTLDALGGESVTALVLAKIDGRRAARLVATLGRFVSYAVGRPGREGLVLIVLARTSRVATAVLVAGKQLAAAAVVSHLDRAAVEAAMLRVAEPCPAALATEAVWSTPAGGCDHCVAGILVVAGEAAR